MFHDKKVFFLVATAYVVAMLFSCRNSIEDIQALQELDSLPVQSVSGVKMTYSDSGILKARLNTPRMDQYEGEEPYIEMPEGLHVEFFSPQGEVISNLNAGYAIKYEHQEIFEARDDVVVINERNERLNTAVLRWNRKEKKIFTDGFVTITRENEILYGDGMEADETFDRWRIIDPSGSFYLQDTKDSSAVDAPDREEKE